MNQTIYSLSNRFYREFEDRFRGARELITERLHVYLPFSQLLIEIHGKGARAIDLGCGRGEWLELLGKQGFSAHGVDLDDGMLEACQELGLSSKKKDAVRALVELDDNTQSVVSGFHIAEHLPFSTLLSLVSHSLRVLKPGGILILETPNPENLRVGANSFYMDPSHERPIPQDLLAFIAEFCGFHRVRVLRLRHEILKTRAPSLLDVLEGTSPDYAIVAQKHADPQTLGRFNELFSRSSGVSLREIVTRYENGMKQAQSDTFVRISAISSEMDSLRTTIDGLRTTIDGLRTTINDHAKKLEMGSFGVRLLLRHPKKFFASKFQHKDFPHIASGHVSNDRSLKLSVRWILRHPGKAVVLTTSHPVMMAAYVFRQPGKFLLGPTKAKGAKNERELAAGLQSRTARQSVYPGFDIVVAVDLTPLQPGGANGGHKPATLALLEALKQLADYKIRFVYLTSSTTHHEVKAIAELGDLLVCVNQNGSFAITPLADETTPSPPKQGFLWDLGVQVLYCPFGAATYQEPGVPTVITIVDLLFKDWPHSLSADEIKSRKDFVESSIKRADRIQCNSRTVMERMRFHYPEQNQKLFYLYLPIHGRLAKENNEHAKENKNPYFLYPANFWKHKNHESLLVAYQIYRTLAGVEAWDLVLTGHEDERTLEIKELAASLGVGSHIRFLGYISDNQLADLYMNASALVFPSLHEGFGIPPVEAMHFGIPSIIGDTFSAPEICGDACIRVDSRKPHDLAQSMYELASNPELAKSLVLKATLRLRLFNLEPESRKLAEEFKLLTYPAYREFAAGFPDDEVGRLVLPTPSGGGAWSFAIECHAHAGSRLALYVGNRPYGSYSSEHLEGNVITMTCVPNGDPLKLISRQGGLAAEDLVKSVRCSNTAGETILLF